MSKFDKKLAIKIAKSYTSNSGAELGLVNSFSTICDFLSDNPDRLSLKKKDIIYSEDGLKILATKYFDGFRKSDFPSAPGTVPDEIVSIVLQIAYGYTAEETSKIKLDHQRSMLAENCVGALLERYIDSILRNHNWHWCCGNFVQAVDFVSLDKKGHWHALQIKNRNNTENSSSSAIRNGTPIQKWFRSRSKSEKTNWENLPESMREYGLSEKGFIEFTKKYLNNEKKRVNTSN